MSRSVRSGEHFEKRGVLVDDHVVQGNRPNVVPQAYLATVQDVVPRNVCDRFGTDNGRAEAHAIDK